MVSDAIVICNFGLVMMSCNGSDTTLSYDDTLMIIYGRDWEHISTMLLCYGTFLLLVNLLIGVLPFVFDTYIFVQQPHAGSADLGL